MSSALMDYFVDKLFPFSSKMNIESSKISGASYLTSANSSSLSHQLCQTVDLFGGLIGDAIFNSESTNQVMHFKQPLGFLSGNYSFNFLNAEKPFSYPMSNLAMNTYRHAYGSSDSRLLSDKILIGNLVNSFHFNQPSEMSRSHKYSFGSKKPPVPPASETKMSENETHSLDKKKCEISNKYTIANTLTLNKELANRKTKEMQKRSKKRRRRQRKNQQFDCSSSASVSDDDVDSSVTSSVTSVCVVSGSAEFGCTLAVRHSVQMTPNMSSFVVTVDSASDDDSEWESYEAEQCNTGSPVNKEADTNIVSSDLVKSKNTNSKYLRPVDCDYRKAASFISSFMVPVENSSDDESDWDTCDTEIFNDTHDFEFSGLLVTSLCTPQTLSPDTNYSINFGEDDETIKLRVHLQEVNKRWNESTQGIEVKPKLPSKVSFAPDEALVQVFPVQLYDRKGEWEIYATERLRFKRKIDELEKILSPCFNPDHRSEVFKRINEPTL